MITNGYLTLPEFKLALGDLDHDGNDAQYERAIEAASRQIDEYRGDQFWKEPTPVPRLFRPDHPDVLWVGDFATTDGVIVELDNDADGTFETTVPATAWMAEPLVRLNGRPFNRIALVGDYWWPVHDRRPLARITASWGWPSVPHPVRQACQILAVDHFKSKDLTGGVIGFGDFGPIRIASFNPQAKALLEQYRLP